MDAKETIIGKTALYESPSRARGSTLRFQVIITDERRPYGRHELEIKPITGSGRAWVNRSTLTIK